MKRKRASKSRLKAAALRVAVLESELKSEYTRRLGKAARRSVSESLAHARRELRRLV